MLLPPTCWADSGRMQVSAMAVDMRRYIVFIPLLRYEVILVNNITKVKSRLIHWSL